MKALLLFLALIQPGLAAHWDGPGAVITWQQPAGVRMTCLYRFYGVAWPAAICWRDLPAGEMQVELPGALTHPAYVPAEGDHFELRFENVIAGSATLGEATVWRIALPLVQFDTRPPDRRIRLPMVRA